MTYFNREGDNLNRRKLKIIRQSATEMIVDIERADSNITNEGSIIDADLLNGFETRITQANTNANTALTNSTTATNNANSALTTAGTANNNASEALSKANTCIDRVDQLETQVTNGLGTVIKFGNTSQSEVVFNSDPQTQINSLQTTILLAVYPVGSIYMSTSNVNPGTLFGGTWEQYAQGRTIIGCGTSDATFTVGNTGGESSHQLTISEIPSHTHTQNAHTHNNSLSIDSHSHTSSLYMRNSTTGISKDYGTNGDHVCGQIGGTLVWTNNYSQTNSVNLSYTLTNASATPTNNSTGGGNSHNNLPPYIVTYIWRRVS